MKTKQTIFTIFKKYMIGFAWAKSGTCWIHSYTYKDYTAREDYLLAFHRTYFRNKRFYLYTIIIGRLNIKICKL